MFKPMALAPTGIFGAIEHLGDEDFAVGIWGLGAMLMAISANLIGSHPAALIPLTLLLRFTRNPALTWTGSRHR